MRNKSAIDVKVSFDSIKAGVIAQLLGVMSSLVSIVERKINPDGDKQKLIWTFFHNNLGGVDVLIGRVELADRRFVVDGSQISGNPISVFTQVSYSDNIHIYLDHVGGKWRSDTTIEKAAIDIAADLRRV